jgi:hypothetical protein
MTEPFDFDGFKWYVNGRSVQFEFVGLQPGQQCQIDFNGMGFTRNVEAIPGLAITPGSSRLFLMAPLDPGAESLPGPIQFTAGMIFAQRQPGGSAILPTGVTLYISYYVEQQTVNKKLDGTGSVQSFSLPDLSLPPTCYIATEGFPNHLGPPNRNCQGPVNSNCCAEQIGGSGGAACPYGYMGEFYCCIDPPYGTGGAPSK